MDTDGDGYSQLAPFFEAEAVVQACVKDVVSNNWADNSEYTFQTFDKKISAYSEQPQLLGPHVQGLTTPMLDWIVNTMFIESTKSEDGREHMFAICKCLQVLCRVRGFKHVTKFFPHEVSQLEGVICLLGKQDRSDHNTWQTRFILLHWLQVIALIPFDICSCDSSMIHLTHSSFVPGSKGKEIENESKLVTTIIHLCKSFLSDTGPTRSAAAVCLSSLLTRPDMDSHILADFMSWACVILANWAKKGETAASELTSDSFRLVGILATMAYIFKKGHRSKILPHAFLVLGPTMMLASQSNQTTTRKLLAKLTQRIGTTFLPPRVTSWRYNRGNRSLAKNLTSSSGSNVSQPKINAPLSDVLPSSAPTTSTDAMSSCTHEERKRGENSDEDETGMDNMMDTECDQRHTEIPDELEDVIDILLTYLQDKDTVVRWSAAKGLGRITMRLPQSLADDIVEAILELFDDVDGDAAWHGGCLALGELSRRGLLLPNRLSSVVPLVSRAIQFDIVRGQHSVGSHVRDASAYVAWAFARAYAPDVMKPFVSELSRSMLLTALFDREINCRRAASAAFQENVGRQGNENFPNGIEIISIADYFSLGNRTLAYLSIAPEIASSSEWFWEPFVDHLLRVKLSHWDAEIRRLASQALAKFTPQRPLAMLSRLGELISDCLSKNLPRRHGATLALSEILVAVSIQGLTIDSHLAQQVANLVPQFEKLRLYRGRGSELFRQASCFLVKNIARAHLQISVKTQVTLVESLNENLRQPHEFVQKAANDALVEFLFVYFPVKDAPSERLELLTVRKYMKDLEKADNAAVSRGNALALGSLPSKLTLIPTNRILEIFDLLRSTSSLSATVVGEADTETRRNAVESSIQLFERASISSNEMLMKSLVDKCLGLLLMAIGDYSIDKRGDTGSWCRIASLKGLERVISTCQSWRSREMSSLDSIDLGYVHAEKASTIALGAEVLTSSGLGSIVTLDESKGLAEISLPDQGSLLHPPTSESHIFHLSSLRMLSNPSLAVGFRLETSILEKILCAVLKQLAEKMDAVREVAGNVLERMLHCPQFHRLSDFDMMKCALNETRAKVLVSNDQNAQDSAGATWAHPHFAFPFLGHIMDRSDKYLYSIASGIIIAVGGLTESVSKESWKVLHEWSEKHRLSGKENDFRGIRLLSEILLRIWEENRHSDRIILPLLKTLQKLMKCGTYDDFFQSNQEHSMKYMVNTRQEMAKCGDVNKLLHCIEIILFLIVHPGDVRLCAMKAILMLLGHKYPRIRKMTAESLYLHILADSHFLLGTKDLRSFVSSPEDLETVNSLLVETPWDGDLSIARAVRSEISEIMNISLAITTKKPKVDEIRAKKCDELDSYESLVREVGKRL